ncbi:MAG: ComEA family DNA-binding protein [Candidatus Delongbacteria bacterium]|jgi:comEA protein|nr:ComEA family DNA-binding protein [Candidatus Delongbacteria bacterium]
MAEIKQSNIENSTYKGLVVLSIVLISIFVFRTLLFSYDIHSYDKINKEFADKKLFSNNNTMLDSSDAIIIEINDQKNINKDLTVNQKIVNINSSLKDDLVKLPGVGPKTADKIIKYRTENGNFETKDDLMKVKGIGPRKLDKLKNLIKLK